MYSYSNLHKDISQHMPNLEKVDTEKNPVIHYSDLKINKTYFITVLDHLGKTPRTDYIHIAKLLDNKGRTNKTLLTFNVLETSCPTSYFKIWSTSYYRKPLYIHDDELLRHNDDHHIYYKEYVFNEVNSELIELLKICHKYSNIE